MAECVSVNVRASDESDPAARAHAPLALRSFTRFSFSFRHIKMFSKRIKLLIILVTFPSVMKPSTAQRSQAGANLRGSSFGLENFLFQRYENANEPTRVETPQRARPNLRPIDRRQTYGPENFNAQAYESTRIKPSPWKRRPVEPEAESSRVKEIFLPGKEPEATRQPVQLEISTVEAVTERIRKRIMMKRRRKRPTNVVQTDDNGEVFGNAILKPVRIPVYPQVPKVVIRTRLPEIPNIPVQSAAEEIIQSELTTEIEKIITSTTTQPTTTTTTTKKTTTTTTTTEKPSTINLKTFLKQQTETLSLSEILQTQNLSLADLIRGNKDASVILKARQTTTTTTTPSRKTFDKPDAEKTEPELPKRMEVLEVTTSRPNYNRFHPKIPRIKAPENAVPKPEENPPKEIEPEETQRQKKRPNSFDPLNRLNEMRLKLRNFQRKTSQPETSTKEESEELPSQITEAPLDKKTRVTFKSTRNPNISIVFPTNQNPEPETLKRPERLTNWTNRLPSTKRFGQERIKSGDEKLSKPLKVQIVDDEMNGSLEEPEEVKTTPMTLLEDTRKPESKDELIELLKSGQNADRLQKILYSRNMTLQELLDNREKAPLQMDITTLFSSHQPRERSSPTPTLFESFPDFESEESKTPEAAYEEPYAEESAPAIVRVELVPPNREPKRFYMDETSNIDTNLDNLKPDTSDSEHPALWKLSEKSIYHGNSYGYGEVFTAEPETEKLRARFNAPELTDSDIILLETIRRSHETNRKFKLDFSDFATEKEPPEVEDIEKSYIPPAVKSAIIASGVVMGIALFVFIAIFATCGWKQRQIRLKSLGDSLSKPGKKSKGTLSPVSYSGKSYKKTIDFDDETSDSGTSNTSSYLWSTLKNTFTSRTSTLKSRMEREEKMKEDKMTLRRNESRRKIESRDDDDEDDDRLTDERFTVRKIDRDRNVINTSFNFKRSSSTCNLNHFNDCVHGY